MTSIVISDTGDHKKGVCGAPGIGLETLKK